MRIVELPICPNRFGRFYDYKIVITCGFREVEAVECVGCFVALSRLNC